MEYNSLEGLEGLGGVSLLEEVCQFWWDLRFQKPMVGPVSVTLPVSLSFCLCIRTELSATSLAPCLPAEMIMY